MAILVNSAITCLGYRMAGGGVFWGAAPLMHSCTQTKVRFAVFFLLSSCSSLTRLEQFQYFPLMQSTGGSGSTLLGGDACHAPTIALDVERMDDWWRRWSFFRGLCTKQDMNATRQWAIAMKDDQATVASVGKQIARKRSHVDCSAFAEGAVVDNAVSPVGRSPVTEQGFDLSLDAALCVAFPKDVIKQGTIRFDAQFHTSLTLCPSFPNSCSVMPAGSCDALHLTAEQQMQSHNLRLSDVPDQIFVAAASTLNLKDPLQHVELTAGLLFCGWLARQRISCTPFACDEFLRTGVCPFGQRCLFVHVPSSVGGLIAPVLDATTPLREALCDVYDAAPELTQFVECDLHRCGLLSVGDVQAPSPALFDSLIHREHDPLKRAFWMMLLRLRSFPPETNLHMALVQFNQVERAGLDDACSVGPLRHLTTVADLCSLRAKSFYAIELPLPVHDACERVRMRYEKETSVFTVIPITLEAAALASSNAIHAPGVIGGTSPAFAMHPFFVTSAASVSSFQERFHNSWSKHQQRPIVTCGMTYVDPAACRCAEQRRAALLATRGGGATSTPVNRATRAPKVAQPTTTDHPPLDPVFNTHDSAGTTWCSCSRKWAMAFNYELSTPSGSRCAEQNVMGQLASLGLPTTAVREVFVHGAPFHGEDPNPLFPCGVCENMLRRISKDLMKELGHTLMLYMFDRAVAPSQLVGMPVTEISHRDGATFKRFVAEDLKEGQTAAGPSGVHVSAAESRSGSILLSPSH